MGQNPLSQSEFMRGLAQSPPVGEPEAHLLEAEATLEELAGVFFQKRSYTSKSTIAEEKTEDAESPLKPLTVEARSRALVEQIPAVVFMVYLDKGIGEAYVSPQIEAALGFSQEEGLPKPRFLFNHHH